MAHTATYHCACCGNKFVARVADRNRGWARFCSKSCKAIKQTQRTGRRAKSRTRHDGISEMKYKHCEVCGEKAVNGVHTGDGRIEWLCEHHMATATDHPHSSEALGQW